MKIILLALLLTLTACTSQETTASLSEQMDTLKEELERQTSLVKICENAREEERTYSVTVRQEEDHQTIQLNDFGLSFDAPSHFPVSMNYGPEIVAVHEQEDETQFATFELKVYAKSTEFTSFEDFATDMETNYIKERIEGNNSTNELSDAELQSELQRFEGHYSFERKEIGGVQVLLHKRDFYGMIGNIYAMYVYSEGKIIDFYSESDHEILDQIYFSLKAQD